MVHKKAIEKINQNGLLLVFPINNLVEPKSLWSEFYPKSKMLWEWNENSDNRVGKLWVLMKALSITKDVVYSKWYQGRATFFSKKLFTSMLCLYQKTFPNLRLSHPARDILDTLESDSPLSTKEVKKLTDLKGKDNEPTYNKAMKQLFSTLQIIAFGEVDDGAFPSLAVGATQLIYEDLWNAALKLKTLEAKRTVDFYLTEGSSVRKYFDKTLTDKIRPLK